MNNMIILVFACFDALLLLVWFKSDAFVEWMNLFGLGNLIKYDEYQNERFINPTITYPLFLKTKYGYFIHKLIGCPLCSSIWQSIITALGITIYKSFRTTIFGVTVFDGFNLINFFTNFSLLCISTIFIFGVISKLLNENK